MIRLRAGDQLEATVVVTVETGEAMMVKSHLEKDQPKGVETRHEGILVLLRSAQGARKLDMRSKLVVSSSHLEWGLSNEKVDRVVLKNDMMSQHFQSFRKRKKVLKSVNERTKSSRRIQLRI